jgi:hypothetical protein
MLPIHLTETEYHLLVGALERECAHLLNEIVHTDNREYRESLEEQEQRTNALLRKLKASLLGTGETEPQP